MSQSMVYVDAVRRLCKRSIDAATRQAKYGRNELPVPEPPGILRMLWNQVRRRAAAHWFAGVEWHDLTDTFSDC